MSTTGPAGNWRVMSTSLEVGGMDPLSQDAIMTQILNGLNCGGPPTGGNDIIRGDVNGDGGFVALIDALFLLNFGFSGGPPPPAPGTMCGPDANGVAALGCGAPACP